MNERKNTYLVKKTEMPNKMVYDFNAPVSNTARWYTCSIVWYLIVHDSAGNSCNDLEIHLYRFPTSIVLKLSFSLKYAYVLFVHVSSLYTPFSFLHVHPEQELPQLFGRYGLLSSDHIPFTESSELNKWRRIYVFCCNLGLIHRYLLIPGSKLIKITRYI